MTSTKKPLRKTLTLKNALTETEATDLYNNFIEKLTWVEGVPSKRGFTRLAHVLDLDSDMGTRVLLIINKVFEAMKEQDPNVCEYIIHGVYLNYYRDGSMYTPSHSHVGTHQLVVSLGATRTLIVGKKSIPMQNGDAVLFGGSAHGVPAEAAVTTGRISIATFMTPVYRV